MNGALWTLCGFAAGASIAVVLVFLIRRDRATLIERLSEKRKTQQEQELAAMIDQLKGSFAALSREAISANSEEFLKLAATRLDKQTAQGANVLDTKKKLIDARLEELRTRLDALNNMIQTAERARAESHGMLRGQLEKATQATHHLHETTAKLNEALSNPQRRGQWGERMADDVLRLVGLVEGINYSKQRKLADGTIPDFTFHLPSGRLVHMDVKFPLANYLKMLDATEDSARDALKVQFLRDVRGRVKEVTSRAYIDPANDTVDYVLVFIPNEQVYGFIHEHDTTLLDYALERKVVLCSPWTLYAILSVIRQAAANFRLEQSSRQILELLADFKKQWEKYVDGMDRLGDRLEAASKEFDQLKGVRTRQLERRLDQIDNLGAQRDELLIADSTPSAQQSP